MVTDNTSAITLNHRKRDIWILLGKYTVLFGIMIIGIYAIMLLLHKSFIQYGDGYKQGYFWTVDYQHKIEGLASGEGFPLWSWSMGTGMDLELDFYLDPFNLIAALFPAGYVELGYSLASVLKMYVGGLSFIAFAREVRMREFQTLAGSLCYVFAGWFVSVSLTQSSFLINAILFPLLILSVERVYKGRSPVLFILVVAYYLVRNIYFAYMAAIVVILYILLRYFAYNRHFSLKEFAGRIGSFILYGIIGVMLSAFEALTAVAALSGASKESSADVAQTLFDPDYYISFGERLIGRGMTYDYLDIGLPILIFLLLPVALKTFSRRSTHFVMSVILLLMMMLPFCCSMFNGFGYPTLRWSFTLIFFAVWCGAEQLEPKALSGKSGLILMCLGWLFIAAWTAGLKVAGIIDFGQTERLFLPLQLLAGLAMIPVLSIGAGRVLRGRDAKEADQEVLKQVEEAAPEEAAVAVTKTAEEPAASSAMAADAPVKTVKEPVAEFAEILGGAPEKPDAKEDAPEEIAEEAPERAPEEALEKAPTETPAEPPVSAPAAEPAAPQEAPSVSLSAKPLPGFSRAVRFAVFALMFLSLSAGWSFGFYNNSGDFLRNNAINKQLEASTQRVGNQIKDKDFYRIDQVDGITLHHQMKYPANENLWWQTRNIYVYNTRIPQTLLEYNRLVGNNYGYCKRVYVLSNGNRMGLDFLLGVRYFLGDDNKNGWTGSDIYAPYGFKPFTEIDGVNVFRSDHNAGLGFVYQQVMPLSEFTKLSRLEREQALLQAAVLPDDEVKEMEPVRAVNASEVDLDIMDVPFQVVDTHRCKLEDGKIIAKKKDAEITIAVESVKDSQLVVSFDNLMRNCEDGEQSESFTIKCNRAALKKMAINEISNQAIAGIRDYDLNMGYCKDFSGLLTISLSKKGTYTFDRMYVSAMSCENFDRWARSCEANRLELTSFDEWHAKGTVYTEDAGILYLSMPVNDNWEVYVDGNKAEKLDDVNITFLGAKVPAGQHEIQLKYRNKPLILGGIVSVIGLVLTIIAGIVCWRRNRKKKKDGHGNQTV